MKKIDITALPAEEQAIILARRNYQRQWRKEHKDAVKEHSRRYWLKKAGKYVESDCAQKSTKVDYKDLAQYLLQMYADYTEMYETARKENDIFECAFYDGRADLAYMILQEKFGAQIDETETEYIARNADFSVTVKKDNVKI